MIKKLRVSVDGKSYDVTVELPDESPAIAPPPPMASPVASAPVASPAAAAPPAAPAAAPVGDNDIPSPLSGRVTAINVQSGQAVKEGEHLLTLEAMKMNTFITAPRDGVVKEIRVAIGSVVDEGQALVVLE
ncbi:MAG TPA: biotin/lipoyl-binding protein [Verrucomicrobiota bacterium]|jgi:biotin carboxyl carrier protein|nr:biotin/lipoyl-binding protein [Verrucomicrobiota bacterium]HPY31504.1 biotin/lipoyl-binding protein [Verrucomicrobiota bacterium]HQB17836.1 biotin/lipoyl-binding protein [Verrucomicrobiota bacterium]